MGKQKLTYKDYTPLSKSEMASLGLKGRQYRSQSTGDIIPVSRFQKLAGSQAPSRVSKLSHVVPQLIHASPQPKVSETLRNRRAFAETYGMTLKQASSDKTLSYLNKLWKKDLDRLNKLVEKRGKKGEQTAEEKELRKSLNDTAKQLGRKKQDNYRDFGRTDEI